MTDEFISSESHKQVLSLRQVRLASTRGHVIIVPAGEPTTIPKALFLEAAKNGCVDYNPRMVEAFKAAIAHAEDNPENDGKEPADTDVVDINAMIKDAVRHVVVAAETQPDLITAHGLPRVPAVRAAFEELCAQAELSTDAKITFDMVQDYYLEVIEEAEAVEHDTSRVGSRYPDGVPGGNLGDEEVGGDVDDMLSRVGSAEE